MDAKEILYAARGKNRNMTEFASEISQDIPVSVATLYRMASGEQQAVSEDLLRAIIKYADTACDYTLADIEAAFKAQSIEVRRRKRLKKALWMERFIIGIILERAVVSGATVSLATPLKADARSREGYIYDESLQLARDGVTQTAYFDIKTYRLQNQMSVIDRTIGRIAREAPSPDKYYYLVFLTERDSTRMDIAALFPQLSDTNLPFNLNIVSIVLDDDGRYSSEQISLGSDEGILSFSETS